jgi:hypothetical protein
MKVTKKELVQYIESLYNSIDSVRPIDLIKGKRTIGGLKSEVRETFDLIEYCLNHPLREWEFTLQHDIAFTYFENEIHEKLNRLTKIKNKIDN